MSLIEHYEKRAPAIPAAKEIAAIGTHQKVAELVDRFVPDLQGKTVLDVPCGQLAFSYLLAQAKAKVIAGDIQTPEAIPSEIGYRTMDANQPLPIADSSIDVIICIEGVEHLDNFGIFFASIERCLKPGGYAFISTPNIDSIGSRIKVLLDGCNRFFEFNKNSSTWKESGHTLPIDAIFIKNIAHRYGLEWMASESNSSFKKNILTRALKPYLCRKVPAWVGETLYYGKTACHVFRKPATP